MPDDEDRAHVKELEAKYPTAMPYFFTQDPDYITVKERVAKHTVDGEEAEVSVWRYIVVIHSTIAMLALAGWILTLITAILSFLLSVQGIATLQIAIETLRVAEYLTPILQEQLK